MLVGIWAEASKFAACTNSSRASASSSKTLSCSHVAPESGSELLCNGPGNEPSQKVAKHQATCAPTWFAEGDEAAQRKVRNS